MYTLFTFDIANDKSCLSSRARVFLVNKAVLPMRIIISILNSKRIFECIT